ncbi:thiamine pyrophosphate-binding protein [Nocardia puris]|uniref:thiamine pyrophosphate-binding protein n=1 Tax=Nocardia puris TaxID=208602 RepID=UPI0018942F6E|nr:thiamine pyrophosphate-binding protein [Nocardia puris]MBF6213496.1 thiamine pyrophosphate-binding protein [Nocardia puris]MBF6365574.1 thiamine pyrophosphate-binding protein [Nocardia puris]MBF6460040.1 thiamine pyrophosphate-binding protein [Nocardia puris]
MPDRVVDHLVRAVSALGARHVFGVDGANIEDLYDALFDSGVTGVVAKHEYSAATMADGYARVTGGLGVVAATSGGGAMNLVAGLAESYASRVPVLALVGQPPTALEGRGAFQDSSGRAGTIDAVALFGSISGYCARVERAAELPVRLADAVAAARRGAPAVLLLPKDVQQSALDAPPFRLPPRPHHRDHSALRRVRAAIEAARRTGKVVILAGDQVARDDARDELAGLAATLDASVGVAPDAKDVYDNTDPGFLGVAGTMGHPELVAALRSAALCLVIGTPLPVTARTGLEELLAEVTVASVGVAPPHLPAVHATSTDLAITLRELAAEFDGPAGVSRPARTAAPTPLSVPDGPGLRYREIVETIGAALPAGTVVFADAGNTGAAVVHHLRVPRGGRFVVALGMGGMGYAFGAGIGAAFARPETRTVVIAGDGAFYMHGMEIHTAVEHRLPITFVVLNNNAHAMCVTREQLYYRDRYSFNRFGAAHLGDGIAAMFPGLPTRTARTRAELDDALGACLAATGPSFVCVECDPDEIPPFAPFLTALDATPRRTP